MFTGTISAFMVERLNQEGRVVRWNEFRDHIVICGWNRKAEIIVREYDVANKHGDRMPIVAIAELDHEPEIHDPLIESRVQFLNDDFTRVAALEKAGIHRAKTCIILSDRGQGRSTQDADARTILAALTAEKLNPNVYTCAELNHREYGTHLEMGMVNDYVISGEHSGFLLAQAALNRGLMGVFTELLTHERGNQFYSLEITEEWVGRSFFDLFTYLKREHNAILVAVHDEESDRYQVNPADLQFTGTERILIISSSRVKL
jgi:voltage-gated potassium channel